MKAVLLGREEPNTPEWDALRANALGGSEIAAVVGLSPWTSRFALWHRKRGTLGKQEVNRGMDWGTRLEPVIAQVFCDAHPELAASIGGTYRHPERAWQIGNPDLLLAPACTCSGDIHECAMRDPEALLEVKTAHQYDAHEWGTPGTNEIPPYYRCQVLWYLDVLGLEVAHIAVLIGGSDYREYTVSYAAEEAAWLREEGAKFWAEVQSGTQPVIDGHTATYEAVRAIHPEIERGVDADIDAEVYAVYAETKAASDEAATEHRRAKALLLDQMGQAQYAEVGGVRVLRRQPGRGNSVSLYTVPQPKREKA